MIGRRRIARWFLGAGLLLAAVVAPAPLSLLLVTAHSQPGRILGEAAAFALAGLILAASFALWPGPRGKARAVAAVVMAVAAGACLAALAVLPRRDGPGESPGLCSVHLGDPKLIPLGLANAVPESDLVRLGATFASVVMPGGKGGRIPAVLGPLYDEIDASPDRKAIGPMTGPALAELAGVEFRGFGHYYAYVPPRAEGERPGLVVFLHGNGGNFAVLAWAWKPFADRHRFAIVCPTFGFGFWDAGAAEAVERARGDAVARLDLDPDRAYLAGLSDGGKGVTRAGSANPDRYRGLIYLSPTMRLDELAAPAFADGWRGRPVMVVHGTGDRSVSPASVDAAVGVLRRPGGSRVTHLSYPVEDHFLFLARREAIFGEVARWMTPDSPTSTDGASP